MKIACYARKSNDKKTESVSNQLSIIDNYIARQKEFVSAEVQRFSDDGYTGMNIEREEFQKMLTKIRLREIDILIVNDLSRLGRNYLEVIKLTESIFPFMGVRVIAVSDGYDSKYKSDLPMDLMTAFKAVLNEFHVIVTSEKLRKSFAHRVRNDSFFGNIPYGYVLSYERQPIIDNEKAEVVKEIFSLFLKGDSAFDIAKTLNQRNILTNRNNQWTYNAIKFILNNVQYTGVRKALAKYRDIKTKKWISAKESDIYINENAFPPIIDKETFEKVQEKFLKKKKKSAYVPPYHVMERKLYCGHCGTTLVRRKNFACYKYLSTGAERCFPGTIKSDTLYPDVLKKVEEYLCHELVNYKNSFSFSDKKKIEEKIELLKENKGDIFESFLNEKMPQSVFINQKNSINKDIEKLNNELNEWRRNQALYTKMNGKERPIDTLKRLYKSEELTKEHMQFVKIINAYGEDDYDIILEQDSALAVLCRNISIFEEI